MSRLHMYTLILKRREIIRMIIEFISIFVMRCFSWKEWTPQLFFEYKNVLADITFAICSWMFWFKNSFISFFDDVWSFHRQSITFRRTEFGIVQFWFERFLAEFTFFDNSRRSFTKIIKKIFTSFPAKNFFLNIRWMSIKRKPTKITSNIPFPSLYFHGFIIKNMGQNINKERENGSESFSGFKAS